MGISWQDKQISRTDDHRATAVARNGRVRLVVCRFRTALKEAQRIHKTPAIATYAMGRLLGSCFLLAADLKSEDQELMMRLQSTGAVGMLTAGVTAAGEGRIDVALHPEKTCPDLPVDSPVTLKDAVQEGRLVVVRDLRLKQPYVGMIDLSSAEIDEDVVQYLYQSEQRPAVLRIDTELSSDGSVKDAVGLLAEGLPGATMEDIAYLVERMKDLPSMTAWLSEGFQLAQIMDLFMGDPSIQLLGLSDIAYACPCSRERMERNLAALPKADLQDLASSTEDLDLICHFCGTHYRFTPEEIKVLMQS